MKDSGTTYIHYYSLTGIIGWPFGIALVSLSRIFPSPFQLVGQIVGWSVAVICFALIVIGARITRRVATQNTVQKHDPVLHQVLRPIVNLALFIPFLILIALYFWWHLYQIEIMTLKSLSVAAMIGGIICIPWVILIFRILQKLEPKEPPIEGPDLPVCPQCGYDLRATPDRCPECGKSPSDCLSDNK